MEHSLPQTFLIFFGHTFQFSIQKLLTAPVPFPLIQMTATFLFFFLFTIPFAFLSDENNPFIAASHCFVVFLLTYGMMGMDFVAVQLDDPFGDDENDFKYVPLVDFLMRDVPEIYENGELVCFDSETNSLCLTIFQLRSHTTAYRQQYCIGTDSFRRGLYYHS